MAEQDFSVTKKIGRPKGRTRPETRPIRIPVELFEALDAWIAEQPEPLPTRPEAVRHILQKALARTSVTGD